MGEGRPGNPGDVSPAFAAGSRIAGYRLALTQEQAITLMTSGTLPVT